MVHSTEISKSLEHILVAQTHEYYHYECGKRCPQCLGGPGKHIKKIRSLHLTYRFALFKFSLTFLNRRQKKNNKFELIVKT